MQIDTAIHRLSEQVLLEAIDEADAKGARAVVVELNTPGGLMNSMRTMTTAILEAETPVVVFVSPAGSQAASAGFFLLMAADVAAMTPGSNTGAAHPVAGQGQDIEGTMGEKIEQDATAFIRSIAQRNGRNVELAEAAVLESRSFSAEEALDSGLIDVVAPDIETLVKDLAGRTFLRDGESVVVDAVGAPLQRKEWTTFQRLLAVLAMPNVALGLLSLGGLALYIEITNPGGIFPGVIGAFFLILGGFSLSILPVNYAGLALLLLAGVLFILEIKVQSFGLLTLGGVTCLVIGSMMLFRSADPVMRASPPMIAGMAVLIVVSVALLARLAWGAAHNRVATGQEGLVSLRGEVFSRLDPDGKVEVRGELWNAKSKTVIDEGAEIVVTAVDGMTLYVEPAGGNSSDDR